MLKALIFDVDGTLADTERDGHRVAFNQAFQAANLDWNWSVERYGELLAITGGKERIQTAITQPLKPRQISKTLSRDCTLPKPNTTATFSPRAAYRYELGWNDCFKKREMLG
jgi:phosphoglycolate phosphatase-like HAD superfamily hydrolase